jgi:hypothetical protein
MANTSAPLSEVGIANMCAAVLDDFPLNSLDDDTNLGRYLGREFGYVRDELLESYPWHFAKTRALLPETTAPAFGWDAAYNLPADCLRLLPLRENGEHEGCLIPYEVEASPVNDGRQVLCNVTGGLKIHYIKRLTNAAKFSPTFARALGSRLAMYASTRVTGKTSYFEKAQSSYMMALDEAYRVDSLTRGTPERTEGFTSLLDVRLA